MYGACALRFLWKKSIYVQTTIVINAIELESSLYDKLIKMGIREEDVSSFYMTDNYFGIGRRDG